jgi:hypothetical protein
MLATFTAHLVALVGKEHVIAFLKKPTGQARQGSARYPTLEKITSCQSAWRNLKASRPATLFGMSSPCTAKSL